MGVNSTVRARLVPLVAVALLMLLALGVTTAHAAETPWGPLTGSPIRIASGEGKPITIKEQESAFAVDPQNGSFFIAYKPDEGSREVVRLQRFNGKGEAGPKIEFKVPSEETGLNGGNLDEGVEMAYDASKHRLYVLLRWEREEQNESKTKPRPAPEAVTAGALYAFEYTGTEIVSLALEEKNKQKVPAQIIGKEALKAQGESVKEPLLHPLGLAVDPVSGNVAILGEQDESNVEAILKEEEKCRAAVQWIKLEEVAKEVKGSLARRYVDSGNVLGKHFGEPPGLASERCGEGEEASGWQAYSPVFTPGSKLLAMTTEASEEEGSIWEVPAAFNETPGETSTTPKFTYSYPITQKLALDTGAEEASEATNPAMSLVSDGGSEGKVYVSAKYSAGTSELVPSLLVLKYAEEASTTKLTELGWLGGRHHFIEKAETPAEIEASSCSLPDHGGGIPLGVAVVGGFKGEGEGVVAFKMSFHELVGVRLGPGGDATKCMRTELESPNVTSNGVKNPPFVSTGVETTLESEVLAGALSSVEWKFEYTTPLGTKGTEPPVTQSGVQLPVDLSETSLKHAFHHPGTYKVTETIASFGNLAGTPEVTATKTISVHSNLKIQLGEPESVPNGEAPAHVSAIVTVPGGAEGEQVEYAWKFGDGTSLPAKKAALNGKHEAQLTAEHVFVSRCGGRCSVTLEVLESPEGPATAETSIAISENATERKEHESKPPSGGGGGGGGGGTPPPSGTGTTTSSPPPPPPPAGNPEAKLAGSALSASAAGALSVKVSCPAGTSSCIGTITLRTASAVSTGRGKKKAILTLASGSFSVAGGQAKTLTLHLSAPARALLAKLHSLATLATLVAHDSAGASRTVKSRATLRLVKGKH